MGSRAQKTVATRVIPPRESASGRSPPCTHELYSFFLGAELATVPSKA